MVLDHTILRVNDVGESLQFYVDVLGLTHEGDQDPFSILRVTPEFTIQLAPWGTKGGEHLAFAMGEPEFVETFGRIRKAGLEFGDSFHSADNMKGPGEETGARGPGAALYLFDPSKHLIEIRHYA